MLSFHRIMQQGVPVGGVNPVERGGRILVPIYPSEQGHHWIAIGKQRIDIGFGGGWLSIDQWC